MKKIISLLLCLCLALGIVPALAEEDAGSAAKIPVFEDGMAQAIFMYTNLRDENYTNDGSDILRFCVYIETDHDTDGDGMADLLKRWYRSPAPRLKGPIKPA